MHVGTQLKELIQRPRPCLRLQGIHELLGCGVAFSFPSNHAVNTAAAAAFFQVLYPKSGWVGWPLTVAIGLSRVYVGVHYVTDVAGGWLLGAMIGGILAWLLRRWSRFQSITQGARNWPRVMRSRLDGRPLCDYFERSRQSIRRLRSASESYPLPINTTACSGSSSNMTGATVLVRGAKN